MPQSMIKKLSEWALKSETISGLTLYIKKESFQFHNDEYNKLIVGQHEVVPLPEPVTEFPEIMLLVDIQEDIDPE